MSLAADIREKQEILRSVYGGSMGIYDVMKELHMGYQRARNFIRDNHLNINTGSSRLTVDTDLLARLIVLRRD